MLDETLETDRRRQLVDSSRKDIQKWIRDWDLPEENKMARKTLRCPTCHADRVIVYEQMLTNGIYLLEEGKCLSADVGSSEPTGKRWAMCCSCSTEWDLTRSAFDKVLDLAEEYRKRC